MMTLSEAVIWVLTAREGYVAAETFDARIVDEWLGRLRKALFPNTTNPSTAFDRIRTYLADERHAYSGPRHRRRQSALCDLADIEQLLADRTEERDECEKAVHRLPEPPKHMGDGPDERVNAALERLRKLNDAALQAVKAYNSPGFNGTTVVSLSKMPAAMRELQDVLWSNTPTPGTGWTRPDGVEFFGREAIQESEKYWEDKLQRRENREIGILCILYVDAPQAVAALCDETLDRSGRLLQRVRAEVKNIQVARVRRIE